MSFLSYRFSSAKLFSTHCCFDEGAIFDYGEKQETKTFGSHSDLLIIKTDIFCWCACSCIIFNYNFGNMNNKTEPMRIQKELMKIMTRKLRTNKFWRVNKSSIQRDLHLKIKLQRNTTYVYKYTKMYWKIS